MALKGLDLLKMRFNKVIIIIAVISIVQLSSLEVYSQGEFNVLKDEFYFIEEVLKEDSLDKARYYYRESDRIYEKLIKELNQLDPNNLARNSRLECFFIYLVVQERKPYLVTGKNTFGNYLNTVKENINSGEINKTLATHILYCYNHRLKDLSKRLQKRISAINTFKKEKLYYLLAHQSFRDSNYEVASKFFDNYLKEIAQNAKYDIYLKEVVKIKDLFNKSESLYYSDMFELYEISLKLENEPKIRGNMLDTVNRKALFCYKNGHFIRALKLYKLFYNYKPDSEVARAIADIYFQNQEFNQAREYFMLINDWQGMPELVFKVGLCYFHDGKTLESYENLNLIIENYGYSEYCESALYYLINMCQDAGLFKERDNLLNVLKERFPSSEYNEKIKQRDIIYAY